MYKKKGREKEYGREYRFLNKEKRAEYDRKWSLENKEKLKEYQKRYRLKSKDKLQKNKRELSKRNKIKAIEYLGNKCQHCGGTFHPSVYDFHHKNPEEKENQIAVLKNGYSWEKIKEELDKCDLLCANCHRLEHWNCEEIDNVS